MKKILALLFVLASAPLVLAGCLKMGPDFAPPPAPVGPPHAFEQADKGPQAYVEQDRWWEDYGDPELNRLVEAALARNWDIKKAAARVMELQAQFGQARAERYPRLDLEVGARKQQSTATNSRLTDRRTETYNLAAAASFEVDLWGRLARAEEAAQAQLLQAEENQRTVIQTLVAEVVTSYLTIESLERRLSVAQQAQNAFKHSLELVESRYNRGLTDVLGLRQARRSLARTKTVMPPLREALGKEQQKLMVLAGRYPRTSPARVQPEGYFPNLVPVPPGLPSELLLRRPDLLASLANLHSLTAQVGQAMAARFPRITLTGDFGYSTDALGDLISPGSELWNIAGGLLQPLFDAGLLEAKQKAAEARLSQALSSYASAALTAFREVESSLLTRREQMIRRELIQESLAEAIATQDAALSRYQRGLTDYLNVLDAQKTRYEVEDDLVLTELSLLSNRVSLHRALGGGWDKAAPPVKIPYLVPDVEPAAASRKE